MAKICNNDSKHSLLRLTLTIEAKCDTTWERSDRINLDRVQLFIIMLVLNYYVHCTRIEDNAPIIGLLQDGGGGESGNPGELDFVKRTWVGNLTSTMIPGVGNLTRPSS